MDFENNEIAIATASAIRYKAGFYIIEKILASGNINRYTMTDRERLMGKKNTYIKEYNTYIDWIAQNVNTNINDCLICNDIDDLIKIAIMS